MALPVQNTSVMARQNLSGLSFCFRLPVLERGGRSGCPGVEAAAGGSTGQTQGRARPALLISIPRVIIWILYGNHVHNIILICKIQVGAVEQRDIMVSLGVRGIMRRKEGRPNPGPRLVVPNICS
jgi:hypothetical protein